MTTVRPTWMGRSLGLLLCALMLAGSPTIATAQDNTQATASPTAEQLRLNSEAVTAIREANHEKAVKLLEASNALGPFNVTWLNLGRAYQKMGECEKARQAYLNVISAPAVKDPSPRLINAKADQYLGELDEECEAAENTGAQMAEGDEQAEQTDGQQHVAELDTKPEPQPSTSSSDTLGWTLTASGLVVAGAGVGAHFWAESIRDDVTTTIEGANGQVVTDMNRQEALDKQSQANTLDTVGVSAIAVGAVVTGTGVYLLLTSDNVEAAPSASITADGDIAIGLTGRF